MTTEKITMPQLGESVTEGTINTWFVKVGDFVNKYDPIADIMTDKVNAEVPSSYSGIIKEIVTTEGETIAVGETMCFIETEGTAENETTIVDDPKVEKSKSAVEEQVSKDDSMKTRYSPAVLKIAQEHDIDLSQVDGTGRSGRITRKDLEKIIENNNIPSKIDRKEAPEPTTYKTSKTGDIEIPVTGVRKVIAQNMVRSVHEIPHAWMTVEVDVTDLVQYRNLVKDDFKNREGFNLTYFAFFIKAISQGLKKYPQLNSTWAGDKIIQRKDINVSIAVAKEEELFVPVIKQADEKSIKGIAKDIYELAIKARTDRLTTEDMQDGTFTVNNTGSFGSVYSMGIINYPQAAILQVESIVKRPVIINDMFAARDIVNLSLSLDHRILDGVICGKFLSYIKETLENMNKNTLNIF
jgi:2-oxoisovalerate dehydrogenase E2 component (dihydrolipoyl transacylase)